MLRLLGNLQAELSWVFLERLFLKLEKISGHHAQERNILGRVEGLFISRGVHSIELFQLYDPTRLFHYCRGITLVVSVQIRASVNGKCWS
ncbi:uncharacterized protein LOC120001731 isoform X2 [Tripterygium wilfordii]|uniref:uncharacterized protein LOC120001731 isoform X2 n=1 Tax=Tripterygium wilfordii TaxID=458696 RepID=UPI0018F806BA|nr:uncharacterized protein LOC120001731 isoform X2 [Tripterygium wilfordii]XP_038706100.1 uncharacterized protein LOC120001731 isoform X2 [Tripterygium wilfordii]